MLATAAARADAPPSRPARRPAALDEADRRRQRADRRRLARQARRAGREARPRRPPGAPLRVARRQRPRRRRHRPALRACRHPGLVRDDRDHARTRCRCSATCRGGPASSSPPAARPSRSAPCSRGSSPSGMLAPATDLSLEAYRPEPLRRTQRAVTPPPRLRRAPARRPAARADPIEVDGRPIARLPGRVPRHRAAGGGPPAFRRTGRRRPEGAVCNMGSASTAWSTVDGAACHERA